jgi:hypothetical protein
MTNTTPISAIMIRISELLSSGNQKAWTDRLDEYRAALPHDYDFALSQTVGLYGRIGSLTDIVLYRNVQPLTDENDELAKLRTRLFELRMEC